MKRQNKVHPYIVKPNTEQVIFGLTFLTTNQLISKILPVQQLWSTTTNKTRLVEKLNQIYEKEHQDFTFDVTWMEDFRELKLTETNCIKVTPLLESPGRILITNERIYFQPFCNISSKPVKKYNLRYVSRVVKRRHSLRQVGLEIYLEDDKSIFFSFKNQKERDSTFLTLLKQPSLSNVLRNDQGNMTQRWQKGLVSNFDYLLYINFIADRSFNDLTQYPVMPWVIQDYTSETLNLNDANTFRDLSKPIGALNPARLKRFKQRYNEMPEPKFLYGSHYSTPGYVLYYLVRQAPEYMLKLQNGRFDAPDREFHSIQSTWNSVLTGDSDVKELIPEFYQSNGDFLINSQQLDLGTMSNMRRVHHVTLPPWANNDAQQFVSLNRRALESEYVSNHLHLWIDLIFGEKQRGRSSVAFDNVFYYLTYEGNVDLESITDPIEKESIMAQVREFGQTPKQVFHRAHPKRFSNDDAKQVEDDDDDLDLMNLMEQLKQPVLNHHDDDRDLIEKNDEFDVSQLLTTNFNTKSTLLSTKVPSRRELRNLKMESNSSPTLSPSKNQINHSFRHLKRDFQIKMHRDKVSSVTLHQDRIISTSHDATVKISSTVTKKQIRRIAECGQVTLSDSCMHDSTLFVASWDNHIYSYSIEYGKVLDSLPAHDDAVTKMISRGDEMVSTSWDSTVKLWNFSHHSGLNRSPTWQHQCDDPVLSLAMMSDDGNHLGACGTESGDVVIFDVRAKRSLIDFSAHTDAVTSVAFMNQQRIVTCSKDRHVKIFSVSGGQEMKSFQLTESLRCLATDGNVIVTGGDAGVVNVWNDDGVNVGEQNFVCGSAVTCLNVVDGVGTMLVGTSDGDLIFYKK
ncbi:neutral sphingomyelinase activation-associated factor [Acrasis kona]|uniref:Neutral sphingomyelinase activation-associated factor n=1 Tax=Acrasis kona TaxID=1008807 RepID=A0AAW2ZFP5_9EUKA